MIACKEDLEHLIGFIHEIDHEKQDIKHMKIPANEIKLVI